jgi:hypothetical protein
MAAPRRSRRRAAGSGRQAPPVDPLRQEPVDAAQAVTLGEIDQCLGAGAATVAGKNCERGERELRVDKRQVALQGEPAAPPRRCARINGWLPVEQRKADRERELEVRATRQLRDKRADLRRGPATRVEQSLEPGDCMTVGRHSNTCSHD